tara:strand:+ start:533 stop:1579 length:1047 start_codon:yes stop_codon:yes gene_type:complete
MAYSSIIKSSDYFNTKLYTGNAGTQAITGVGFQPDWVWIKTRADVNNHTIFDAVRGVTKRIRSNQNNAESTSSGVTSFDSDGFTVGSDSAGNSGTMVSWNWKANGAGSSNTDGSITSTVSANTTSGFSIVKYSGNSNSTSTIGHGLGVAPSLVMIKNLGQAEEWVVGVNAGSLDFTQYAYLNLTNAFSGNAAAFFNNTNPSSNLIYIGNSGTVNGGSSYEHIAYCFADVQGFSKMGSYVGNGNADGTFVYTGFKPAFVMTKPSSGAGSWYMLDNKRANPFNAVTGRVEADGSGAENTGFTWCDFTSNGFKIRTTEGGINANGVTYIYMAFAEAPFTANVDGGLPTTAR